MLVDYHIHVAAHGEYNYSPEWIESFLLTAAERNISEIGLSEHEEYSKLVDLQAIEKAGSKMKEIKLRLGLEADYIPGQESATIKVIEARNYDYIIGSVHFINGWGFDHPDFRKHFDDVDVDEIYQAYFQLIMRMVQSRLYDIVGHMDLIKLWGHRSSRPISTYTAPVLKAIKSAGMAVELNSAGLRKPVHEFYPAKDIINDMYNMNIPITLGSDAHHPDQVGEDFDILIQAAKKAGYNSIVTLSGHIQHKALLQKETI